MNEYRQLSQLPTRLQKFLAAKLAIDEMLVVAWQPDSKEYQPNQGAIRIFGLFWCAFAVGLYLAYGSTPGDLLRTSDDFVIHIVCGV